MLKTELKKLDLSSNEIKLYLALLELGEANLQRIIQKADIKRTTAYDIVESLKKKGLVKTTVRGKRIFYFASNPNVLGEKIDEKKKVFDKVLPQLLSMTNLIGHKPKIQFFDGVTGIKKVYEDTIKNNNGIICAWLSADAQFFDPKYLLHNYIPKRIKNNIFVRAIAIEDTKSKNLQKNDKEHMRTLKLVSSQDNLFFEVEINLYANYKIAIMSFKEEFGLIIESKKIYNTLKAFFEIHWKFSDK